jgi:hypothetical protein
MDEAWDLGIDQVQQVKAIAVLRKAVKIDPDFALGHELLAQMSFDGAEQLKEQQKAVDTRNHASVAEQSIVDWFQNAADHNVMKY